jgi:hypothetical protein
VVDDLSLAIFDGQSIENRPDSYLPSLKEQAMEWAKLCCDFVAKIVQYIAWPGAALLVLFVLRKPLTDLIDRLKEYEGHHGTLRFGETKAPPPQPAGEKKIPDDLSREAKKILATLWQGQVRNFNEDFSKRWSFRLLPNAQRYGAFMVGFAQLLDAGLVAWTEKDGQAFLTNEGIDYIKKHPDVQGSDDRYTL